VVGRDCALDLLIEDIAAELAGRPYEIARIAGGWQFRTRPQHAASIRAARGESEAVRDLTQNEALVLTIIAYMQPVTRVAISQLTGREVSRDLISRLHRQALIARGPRSPEPGAPYTYVTTPGFLVQFGLETLRDLPELEALEDAGTAEANGRPRAGSADRERGRMIAPARVKIRDRFGGCLMLRDDE
jgi:segregation and condensation protein B